MAPLTNNIGTLLTTALQSDVILPSVIFAFDLPAVPDPVANFSFNSMTLNLL